MIRKGIKLFKGKQGYLLWDVLVSCALMLIFSLVVSTYITASVQHFKRAKEWEHIVQKSVILLETGKEDFRLRKEIFQGDINETPYVYHCVYTNEEINALRLPQYTVLVEKDNKFIFETTTNFIKKENT